MGNNICLYVSMCRASTFYEEEVCLVLGWLYPVKTKTSKMEYFIGVYV